jgi:hypothetical protein
MIAIKVDKSRLIPIFARQGRAGSICLKFKRKSDGTPFSIAGILFEFFAVKHVVGGDKLISLTIGAGLTVSGDDDDELNIVLTADHLDLLPATYHYQLVNLDVVKTWLNGPLKVHAGDFDGGITEEEEIVINTGDDVLNVTINDVAAGGDHFRGEFDFSAELFPEAGGSGAGGAVKAGDFWFFDADVADFLGEEQSAGTLAMARIDDPGQVAANWRLI